MLPAAPELPLVIVVPPAPPDPEALFRSDNPWNWLLAAWLDGEAERRELDGQASVLEQIARRLHAAVTSAW